MVRLAPPGFSECGIVGVGVTVVVVVVVVVVFLRLVLLQSHTLREIILPLRSALAPLILFCVFSTFIVSTLLSLAHIPANLYAPFENLV